MSTTPQYTGPLKSTVAGMLVPVLAFAFEVGTGGAATRDYVKNRESRGYPFANYYPQREVAGRVTNRTPAENLNEIRAILKPTVTTLADALRVSRQAIYDWQAGKAITFENASRLEDLARAAEIFSDEGLAGQSRVFHRSIKNGKNFFEIVKEGGSACNAARTLVEIIRTESRQREALRYRLAGRRRPSREAFEDIGTPMLDERG